MAILKLFINDRNIFTIEERKNLGIYQDANVNVNENHIISQHNTMTRWWPTHWVWLWLTIEKMTNLQAILRQIFLSFKTCQLQFKQQVNNSHSSPGSRIWTETRSICECSWWNYTQNIFPRNSKHRFNDFCISVRTFYYKHDNRTRQGYNYNYYTRSNFVIIHILTFITYDVHHNSIWRHYVKILLIFQTRIHYLTRIHSWRVMENIRREQKLQQWEVLWAMILNISLLSDTVHIGLLFTIIITNILII